MTSLIIEMILLNFNIMFIPLLVEYPHSSKDFGVRRRVNERADGVLVERLEFILHCLLPGGPVW